jgi:putative hydrolase of the HAD superfamily
VLPSALLLDAEGTLMHLAEPAHEVYARHAASHGIDCAAAEIARVLPQRILERGAPPVAGVPLERVPGLERESWRAVIRDVLGSAAADGACFDSLFAHYGTVRAWRTAEGALAALREVRAAGWRIAIVSNMDARLGTLLGDLGLAELIDAALFPARSGLAKPDARIFRAALAELGLPDGGGVYVGDRERDCLEAARRAGLQTLRYDPDGDPADPQILPTWDALRARLAARPDKLDP